MGVNGSVPLIDGHFYPPSLMNVRRVFIAFHRKGSNNSVAWLNALIGTTAAARISRFTGRHQTRLTSACWPKHKRWRRHDICKASSTVDLWTAGFAGSRLSARGALSHGQAMDNALRCPPLAHRSAPAHKLHSAQATIFSNPENQNYPPAPALAYSTPVAFQATVTTADQPTHP